ncbi:MAG TPA: 50S ribosomal protein L25 [Actinomycetota bacterium]|jgi:large subunit ribosomal protein L25
MERKMTAEPRDVTGKGAAHKIRASGRVPGVVYGHGDPVKITVDARELYHLLHTEAGANVLVDLKVDGETYLAMPREIQRDLLRDSVIHVDFLRIDRDQRITVEVPIHIVGESHGVREGGVVEHHLWNLQLECLPQDVPAAVEADITTLGIGESLKVADLDVPDSLTVLSPLDETVVSVVTPQVLRVEEAPAEGEVEGAEAAEEGEGAEAPAAEGAASPEAQGGDEGS